VDLLSGQCTFKRLEKVIFGPGKVAQLPVELQRLSAKRVVIATNSTLGKSRLLDELLRHLGPLCVGVFRGCRAHVPAETVRELTALLKDLQADSVVSFGGGSANDTAKVAVASILNDRDMTLDTTLNYYDEVPESTSDKKFVHIAVPTALSAAEYNFAGGITDGDGVKQAIIDYRLQPRVVINDPLMTMETPDTLWTSTGIRALDHAVEAHYSANIQTITYALASHALRLITSHLPASVKVEGEQRVAHRGFCQTGAWLSICVSHNSRGGVSHAIGHKIGPRFNIPHGVTSAISMPPSIRFMARRAPERLSELATNLGIKDCDVQKRALMCADVIEEFIGQFHLPTKLREFDVSKDQLEGLVDLVHYEIDHHGAFGLPIGHDEVAELLLECW
jgi:alcohol dehydrogenase class IV